LREDPGPAGGAPEDEAGSGRPAPRGRPSITQGQNGVKKEAGYSTVTLLARLRGWSTSQPLRTAMW
jgi:hypothetical protein